MYQSARRSTDHDGLHIYLAELAVERDWVGQLWPLAPKEGVWGGKMAVIGLNHYGIFSANNVEEQHSGDIHMYPSVQIRTV